MAANHYESDTAGLEIPALLGANSPAQQTEAEAGHAAPESLISLAQVIEDMPRPDNANTGLFAEGFGFNDDGVVSDDLNGWHPALIQSCKASMWSRAVAAESNPAWQVDFHLGFAARMALVAGEFD